MLALVDGAWVAVGGMGVALVTGTFAFLGVLVSAKAQKDPTQVKVGADTLALRDSRIVELKDDLRHLEAEHQELRQDRNFWRAIAIGSNPALKLLPEAHWENERARNEDQGDPDRTPDVARSLDAGPDGGGTGTDPAPA